MKIGFIGASNIARAFSRHLLKTGHSVVLSNRRGPASLEALVAELGPGASAATVERAATSELVILALPWIRLTEALQVAVDWNGRTVIDATNAFLSYAPDYRPADLKGRTSSEIVAEMLPGARVVKTLNTLPYQILEQDPQLAGGRRVLFLSGDDRAAKDTVATLLSSVGFAPIDLGSLIEGGRMQQMDGPLARKNLVQL